MADNTRDRQNHLVVRAQHGDTDAFAELTTELSPRLLSAARRVVGNTEDAQNVMQESLWKAFQHLPEYRAEAVFSSWLIRITINQAIGLLRHRRADPLDLSAPDADPALDESHVAPDYRHAPAPTPEEICSLHEMRAILRQCLERLDPAYRRPLCLGALEGWSHAEVAEQLGVSVATVKTRIHRARRMLRRILPRPRYAGVVAQVVNWPNFHVRRERALVHCG